MSYLTRKPFSYVSWRIKNNHYKQVSIMKKHPLYTVHGAFMSDKTSSLNEMGKSNCNIYYINLPICRRCGCISKKPSTAGIFVHLPICSGNAPVVEEKNDALSKSHNY